MFLQEFEGFDELSLLLRLFFAFEEFVLEVHFCSLRFTCRFEFVEAQFLVFACEASEVLEDHHGFFRRDFEEEVECEADFVLVEGAGVAGVDQGEVDGSFHVRVRFDLSVEHASHGGELVEGHAPALGALRVVRHEEAGELDDGWDCPQREVFRVLVGDVGQEVLYLLVVEDVAALGQLLERSRKGIGVADCSCVFDLFEFFFLARVEFQSPFLVLFLCSFVQSIQTQYSCHDHELSHIILK